LEGKIKLHLIEIMVNLKMAFPFDESYLKERLGRDVFLFISFIRLRLIGGIESLKYKPPLKTQEWV